MLSHLLRTYLSRHRRALGVVIVLQFVQTMAALMLPRISQSIVDSGIARSDRAYVWRMGALMLVISLAQVALSVLAVRAGAAIAMAFGRDVRRDLFRQGTSYSTREVNQIGASSLITRVTNDVQQVQMLVVMGVTMLVTAPLTMIGGVFMALRADVGLSALLVVAVPVLAGIVGTTVTQMVPTFRDMQARIDNVNKILREQIVGMRVVRAFVREPDETVRFEAANAALTEKSLAGGRLMSRMFPSVMFTMNLSMVAAVWVGADRVTNGSMKIGALIAFLTYIAYILGSVMMATFVVIMIPRASVCAERIVEVLNTQSSVLPPTNPESTDATPLILELRNVSFQYPGAEAPVVNDVSFSVRAGETLAIIGSTGSGKTTITQLIPRLVDATTGTVLLGGVDVRNLAPQVLTSTVGIVPQRPYLFSGTVATNLRFGNPAATDDELWRALEIAQAADFVRAMPAGLDAPISQGGSNVSGGQRQRLAIARAIVHQPTVFLFDDSFSALDLATDARLRAALKPVTRDAIVVLVAQRVSTIIDADQILVLEDGEAVGLGSHDELLHRCPTYAEIVHSQLSASEVAA